MFTGRHLNLDQATFEPGENKAKVLGRELSLQMKLDYFEDEDVTMLFSFYIIAFFFKYRRAKSSSALERSIREPCHCEEDPVPFHAHLTPNFSPGVLLLHGGQ